MPYYNIIITAIKNILILQAHSYRAPKCPGTVLHTQTHMHTDGGSEIMFYREHWFCYFPLDLFSFPSPPFPLHSLFLILPGPSSLLPPQCFLHVFSLCGFFRLTLCSVAWLLDRGHCPQSDKFPFTWGALFLNSKTSFAEPP